MGGDAPVLMRLDVYKRIKALRVLMEQQVRTPEDLHSPEVLQLSRRIDRLVLLCYKMEPSFEGWAPNGHLS